ncbi:Rap1a/Tai family immunity protein [Pseudomonas yamanorum]|uniref:Rap1a/Tai family immunity protein n=1 Tax=Pseudomonas yamanorum TaxID=515393 RepID=UPI000A8F3C3D|nr:Rap1a/Tai family immunity protein [Pseudomonas yamanorum]
MKRTSILTALSLCVFSLTATASNEAHDYLTACREARKQSPDAPPSYQAAYCLGITTGVLRTLEYKDEFTRRNRRLCQPENLEPGHLVEMVLEYSKKYPAAERSGTTRLVRGAITERYPCPKRNNTL